MAVSASSLLGLNERKPAMISMSSPSAVRFATHTISVSVSAAGHVYVCALISRNVGNALFLITHGELTHIDDPLQDGAEHRSRVDVDAVIHLQ